MRRDERIQDSGSRIQSGIRKQGRWTALLLVALLAGCASPKAQFTDADWVSHATTGRGAYERGDYRRAADAFGRAQERARALDDADALAVAAVNRALSLVAAGQAAAAVAAADEALMDARISKSRRAELLAAGARAELAGKKPEAAVARAEDALKLDPEPTLRAQILLAKGAAELAREDAGMATKALEGLSAKEWGRLPASLRAEEKELLAKIATAGSRPAEAKARLDEAAVHWKEANRLPEMARALAEAGRQAKASGDLAGACDRFYRAARSLWAQEIRPEAARTLEEGVSCAEQLEDEAVAKRMAELFVTFKQGERLSK